MRPLLIPWVLAAALWFAMAAFLVMDLQIGLAFGFVCALLLKVMVAGARRS